jgi:gamma-glutamyltranspeptidase/glutathione hydrolase
MPRRWFLFLALLIPFCGQVGAGGKPTGSGKKGMVVSVSRPASEVGLDILKQGGNAVDAAVATAFALAVTHPAAGNIGGGGFMLVFPPDKKAPDFIDYRETAPAAATKTMFDKNSKNHGHRVAGVPGTVRGLALAHKKYGKLPWKTLVAPAVILAEEGFALDKHETKSLNGVLTKGPNYPEMVRVYGKAGGKERWQEGDRLVQRDLAKTLRRIADGGPDAFYTGMTADLIAAEMKAGGGLITREDLANYRAKERVPVHGTYRGYDIYSAPPPSSGGTALVEMLNILENYDLRNTGQGSPQTLHLMVEAMRRAYCDRAKYLGDPDFTKIPDFLTAKVYAKEMAATINPDKATPSEALARELLQPAEGESTTHFSVIDGSGLAVSNTYTLENSYGCRVVVKGAGFLLNNEMSDFNWFPGVTDRKGRIGTPPNQIAPGKRMLSSMTPTIVAKDGKAFLITGSPGGRTIINTLLCVVTNVIDFGLDVQAAVDAPRLHHQWFPDDVKLEKAGEREAVAKELRRMGHRVAPARSQGDAHSILIDPRTGRYIGAADRRLSGYIASY